MKNFAIIFISTLILVSIASSQPDLLWSQSLGRISNIDIKDIDQTSNGGYVIAAFSRHNDDQTARIIKTDAEGNSEWQRSFSGTGVDRANAVQETSDGGFLVVGKTEYYAENGSSDILLIKYTANGFREWFRTYGNDFDDNGKDIQSTNDGGYIITGQTENADGETRVLLIKLDSDMNDEWIQEIEYFEDQFPESITQTSDNGFAIAGETPTAGGMNFSRFFIMKTDSLGNYRWNVCNVARYNTNFVSCVKQAPSGDIVAAGTTNYTYPEIPESDSDGFLVCLTADGVNQWTRTFDGDYHPDDNSIDFIMDLDINETGYILAGISREDSDLSYGGWLIQTDFQGRSEWQEINYDVFYDKVAVCEYGGFTAIGTNVSSSGSIYIHHYGYDNSSIFQGNSETFSLVNVYPNPFNSSLNVTINLETQSDLYIKLFNLNGQELEAEIKTNLPASGYYFNYDMSRYTSGVYFLQIYSPGILNEFRRVFLVK